MPNTPNLTIADLRTCDVQTCRHVETKGYYMPDMPSMGLVSDWQISRTGRKQFRESMAVDKITSRQTATSFVINFTCDAMSNPAALRMRGPHAGKNDGNRIFARPDRITSRNNRTGARQSKMK